MEHKIAKYSIWSVIIAAIITGGVALYIHFDGKNNKSETEEIRKQANQSKDTANLTIINVFLPPVNTKLESAFYAEITNNSLNAANDIQVTLNFGISTVSNCETLPNNAFETIKDFKDSVITFSVKSIKRKESLHIYCLISNPVFDSIIITGPNLFNSEKLTFEDFDPIERNGASGFVKFFKVVGSIVAVIFIIYFTILIINVLNKFIGTKLD